ncbi:phage tail fiber protein [Raoultella sp. WB_B2P2-3]|uniref:phage tail fiber protein n=1 Tax=Raoultella scottii TaxID=3040937 RepID=UPI002F929242
MAEVPLPTPTQVPVPSTDIRNVVFAGAKLDEEVTGTGEFYTDRLGVQRLTNAGRTKLFNLSQQDRESRFNAFIQNSGYEIIGDYTAGPLTLTEYNQLIRYNNELYKLTAAIDIPFTTAGNTDETWTSTDAAHFVSVGDAALRQNLGSSEGLSLVGQVPDIYALRYVQFSFVSQQIFVAEHTIGMGQGGGIFYCHSLTNDDGLIDDNGFQIINNYGQVIRRKDRGRMSAEMFGAIGGSDLRPILDNMFIASRTFNIIDAYIPYPLNNFSYLHSGGSEFDIGDGLGFYLHGISLAKGVPINHTGQNTCFRFFKNYYTAEDFWASASIDGFIIRGRTLDNTAEGNSGISVQWSDMWGFRCIDMFIVGYTNSSSGAAISIYNDSKYTEGSYVRRVMIRRCCTGVWIHRNMGAGYTSTNSFFGSDIEYSYQAGVAGQTNMGLKIGNGDGTTTANTFDINFYGSKVSMRYWAEAGSSTSAVNVIGKSIVPESSEFSILSDGYGFSASTSDTSTTPATRLIYVRDGGIFRARVSDLSNQTATVYPLNQIQRIRNTVFSYQDDIYKTPYLDSRPYINPTGMTITCAGVIDVATQKTGYSWMVSGLPMCMELKVSIWQYYASDVVPVKEEWLVYVRGDSTSVIATPVFSNDVVTQATGSALIDTAGSTATFVKTTSNSPGRFWQGDGARTRLTVRNINDDNSLTTGDSVGRKFRIFLPANPSATSVINYSVKVEVV